MTVYSTDTFNRTDSSSVVGSTDGSGALDPLTWTTQQGTCGISSNQGYASALATAGGLNAAIATVDLSQSNVDLSLTLATISTNAALVFRFSDTSNYWLVYEDATNCYLYKNVAASLTQVGSSHSGSGAGDVMRVVAYGSSIAIYRGGNLLEVVTDSFNSTATKHGYFVQSTSSRVDNFSAASASITSSDSFNRTNSSSTVGSTDGGGSLDPLTWTTQIGTCGISSNTAYASAVSGSRGIATVPIGQADVDISLVLSTAPDAFICFRYSDLSNYWYWGNSNALGPLLVKRVAGSGTSVYNSGSASNGDTFRVLAVGNSISIYKNGILQTTVTDSFNNTATIHGIYFEAITARVDNFLVAPTAPSTNASADVATATSTANDATTMIMGLASADATGTAFDVSSATADTSTNRLLSSYANPYQLRTRDSTYEIIGAVEQWMRKRFSSNELGLTDKDPTIHVPYAYANPYHLRWRPSTYIQVESYRQYLRRLVTNFFVSPSAGLSTGTGTANDSGHTTSVYPDSASASSTANDVVPHLQDGVNFTNSVDIVGVLSIAASLVQYDTWRPVYAPDNSYLIVCRTPEGEHDTSTGLTHMTLWSFQNDGSGEKIEMNTPSTFGFTSYSHPEFSPDGAKAVLTVETATEYQLTTVDTSSWGRG